VLRKIRQDNNMGSYEDWSSRAVAPQVLQQEARIGEQRELIAELDAAVHAEMAKRARAFPGELCNALISMRLDERRKAIRSREESFAALSEEETLTRVMHECTL
jgi:hypothetical protein